MKIIPDLIVIYVARNLKRGAMYENIKEQFMKTMPGTELVNIVTNQLEVFFF